jgi:DUF1680 family protein
VDRGTGHSIALEMQTDYPWQGQIQLAIRATDGSAWQLRLRVPEWCSQARVSINGQAIERPRVEAGYLVLERAWQLEDVIDLQLSVEPMLVEAHPRIDAVRGSLGIQRGPLVYCLEAVDHAGLNLMDIRLDETAPLQTNWREDAVLGNLMVIQASGYLAESAQQQIWRLANLVRCQSIPLVAVPLRLANAQCDARVDPR